MTTFDLDENGFPVILAPGSRRAPVVEDLADPSITVRSGNPHRAPAGRFGKADKSASNGNENGKVPDLRKQGGGAAVAASLGEQHRRDDAVRDAAREFETFATQDLKDWLPGRITRALSEAEFAQFEADVRAQQLADISDVLDQITVGESRGRRQVKVKAPKGYVRKTLGALSDDELLQLGVRLQARGWTERQLKDGLVNRLSLDRRDALSALISPTT